LQEHFGVAHSAEIKMDDFQAILHWLDPKAFEAPEKKDAAPKAAAPKVDDAGPYGPDGPEPEDDAALPYDEDEKK
jgi:hypothetical protein